MGANGIETFVQRLQREMEAVQGQLPGREGRRSIEDEQEQGRISQRLVLPAPGGINEGTPASGLELDLPRVWSAPGECGGAGKSGTLGIAREVYQTLQVDVQWKRLHSRETCEWKSDEKDFCKNEKKRETARVRTQGPSMNTAKVRSSVPLKQTAKERIQEPLETQL